MAPSRKKKAREKGSEDLGISNTFSRTLMSIMYKEVDVLENSGQR